VSPVVGGKGSMHRTSHVELLTPLPRKRKPEPTPRPGSVDAIVVPTNRLASSLAFAIELAAGLECPILVLCSGESRAARVATQFGAARGVAVTVSSTPSHPLLSLPTQHPSTFLARPYVDTGNKRNVALLVARMLRWRRVLFLDDDIFGLPAEEVNDVAAVISPLGLRVIGWRSLEFPDNSVACHALRSSGHDQDVFIGAGALLVDVTGGLPFFPSVYNEEWLFWHDFVARQGVGQAGTVKQRKFNPYADEHRARQEEFGDVLAEGLYALIHERRSVLVACLPGYWDGVVADRQEMLDGVEQRLSERSRTQDLTWDGYGIAQVLTSVRASRETVDSFTALDLAEFVGAWRYDLFCWNARLPGLPRLNRIADALDWLGLSDIHGS
jgi:hypothetical protein